MTFYTKTISYLTYDRDFITAFFVTTRAFLNSSIVPYTLMDDKLWKALMAISSHEKDEAKSKVADLNRTRPRGRYDVDYELPEFIHDEEVGPRMMKLFMQSDTIQFTSTLDLKTMIDADDKWVCEYILRPLVTKTPYFCRTLKRVTFGWALDEKGEDLAIFLENVASLEDFELGVDGSESNVTLLNAMRILVRNKRRQHEKSEETETDDLSNMNLTEQDEVMSPSHRLFACSNSLRRVNFADVFAHPHNGYGEQDFKSILVPFLLQVPLIESLNLSNFINGAIRKNDTEFFQAALQNKYGNTSSTSNNNNNNHNNNNNKLPSLKELVLDTGELLPKSVTWMQQLDHLSSCTYFVDRLETLSLAGMMLGMDTSDDESSASSTSASLFETFDNNTLRCTNHRSLINKLVLAKANPPSYENDDNDHVRSSAELFIKSISNLRDLSHLDMNNFDLDGISLQDSDALFESFESLIHLRHLCLPTGDDLITEKQLTFLETNKEHYAVTLEYLSIGGYRSLASGGTAVKAIASLVNLKALIFGPTATADLMLEDFLLLTKNLHKLEELNLEGAEELDDSVMAEWLPKLTRLRNLNLSNTDISNKTTVDLFETQEMKKGCLRCLEELHVAYCHSVTSIRGVANAVNLKIFKCKNYSSNPLMKSAAAETRQVIASLYNLNEHD